MTPREANRETETQKQSDRETGAGRQAPTTDPCGSHPSLFSALLQPRDRDRDTERGRVKQRHRNKQSDRDRERGKQSDRQRQRVIETE